MKQRIRSLKKIVHSSGRLREKERRQIKSKIEETIINNYMPTNWTIK